MADLTVVEPQRPSPLGDLAQNFLADCRARGLSIRTVEAYDYPVRRAFLPWCAGEGITDPSQLTPALVGRFTARLLDEGGNIISLPRILGHSDLSMIQGVYSHLDSSEDYQAAMRVLLGQD